MRLDAGLIYTEIRSTVAWHSSYATNNRFSGAALPSTTRSTTSSTASGTTTVKSASSSSTISPSSCFPDAYWLRYAGSYHSYRRWHRLWLVCSRTVMDTLDPMALRTINGPAGLSILTTESILTCSWSFGRKNALLFTTSRAVTKK